MSSIDTWGGLTALLWAFVPIYKTFTTGNSEANPEWRASGTEKFSSSVHPVLSVPLQ